MNSRKKRLALLFVILGMVIVIFGVWRTGKKSHPYIQSDKIVYKTDSIDVVHRTSKEFDEEGRLYLLSQLGIGTLGGTEPEEDAFVLKTSVDTGESIELYEQKGENWVYKADGWFQNYASYEKSMLCADYVSERKTYGEPTPCLAVIDLETKKEWVWNLSALSGKAVFTGEGKHVSRLVWLNREEVAVLAGNEMMRFDVVNGKLMTHSKIAEVPFENWNLSGTVLSYVIKDGEKYLFEAVELGAMKKLASIDAGEWREGFGEYDMLYCDGEIYKIDKESLYRYSDRGKRFEKIYSGIKMQETWVNPDTEEACYNYCRLYGTDRHCLYVMHVSEYAGECSFCRIHRLELIKN